MTSGEPMTGVLIGVAMVVALAVLWLVFEGLKSRQKKETLESQMNELRRDLQSVATAQAKRDRKSTRLNSSHPSISYAVFCLKKKMSVILLWITPSSFS